MDTESTLTIFLSFLMVGVVLLSYGMEDAAPSAAVSSAFSPQSTLCEEGPSISTEKNQPIGVKKADKNKAPSQDATTVSSTCNSYLYVIPVEKQNLNAPSQRSLIFPPYTTTIPSEAFVFQEPDPPRII